MTLVALVSASVSLCLRIGLAVCGLADRPGDLIAAVAWPLFALAIFRTAFDFAVETSTRSDSPFGLVRWETEALRRAECRRLRRSTRIRRLLEPRLGDGEAILGSVAGSLDRTDADGVRYEFRDGLVVVTSHRTVFVGSSGAIYEVWAISDMLDRDGGRIEFRTGSGAGSERSWVVADKAEILALVHRTAGH